MPLFCICQTTEACISWRKRKALTNARVCVQELAELWPGEHVFDNEETGERFFASTRNEREN